MTTFFSSGLARPALALLGLGLLGLASCQTDIDAPAVASPGNASFTRYIAVGNSLTAGYEDGGLYLEGQQNSYPSILAQQFAKVGGGQFRQPLFTTAQANGSGYLRLAAITNGSPVTQNVTTNLAVRTTTPQVLYTKYTDPVENLGVPGILLADVQTPGYGSVQGNPFFERITPDATPLQTYFQRVKAEAATATFFSMWLGNNDVLGYATAGGAVASRSITRTDTFNLKAVRMINALTAPSAVSPTGARGVVSNIPDVTGIPFFTTVGPSFRAALPATVPTAAPFVYTTGILAPVAGVPNTRVTGTLADIRTASGGSLLLTLTAAPYVGLYGQATGKYWRDFYVQATGAAPRGPFFAGFLAVLQVDTTKAFGQSTGNPFPSTLVLDATEQTAVSTATTAFNNSLQAAATTKNLAFFDANAFFRNVATTGVASNGINNTANYLSGNLFSLDGVHPTPRGYALVANQIIMAINARYGGSIPQVNPNDYRGVLFP